MKFPLRDLKFTSIDLELRKRKEKGSRIKLQISFILTLYFALFTLQLFEILHILVAHQAIKPQLLATGRPPSFSPDTIANTLKLLT